MSFFTLPPEINSLRMFLGAGSAPMLQAAAAWEGLAEELGSAANSFMSVTTGLAGQAWQGAASAAMAAAAAPYAAWLNAAAAQSSGAGGQARALASMFEAAKAATVIPQAIDTNRNAFVNLVMSNLFGQNAGLIAMAESIYEEMWAADVAAMAGYYSGASSVAAQLVPWANVLKGLPGLAGGMGGAAAGGAGPGGAAGGGGGATGGSGNTGGGDASGGSGTTGATGGGASNLGGGSYVNGGTADPGLAPGDPTSGAATAANGTIGGYTPAAGVGGTGMGMMPIPIPLANAASSGLLGPTSGTGKAPAPEKPAAEAAETAAEETVEEVEAPVPQMGVLPTTPGEIAAKAETGPPVKTPATPAAGSGIPASKLRAGAKAKRKAEEQDQEEARIPAEAAEAPTPLRPEAEPGKLRPPAEEEPPGLQVRGG